MSLAETLVVSNGTTNKSFSTTNRGNNSTTRTNREAPNNSINPCTIIISNQKVTKKGYVTSDRILVGLRDQSTARNTAGNPETARWNLTGERPQFAEFDDARMAADLFMVITAAIGSMSANPAAVTTQLGRLFGGES